MFVQLLDVISSPKTRHPKHWRPAFLAMQFGFIAGGLGLLGRDLLIFLTVADWVPIIVMELAFGLIIGVGFILHNFGFASSGVILACVGGIGSATAFIMLIGWSTAFYLWYVNLAVLLLAVPISNRIKWPIAICFIGVYSLAYLFLSGSQPVFEIPALTRDVLAISNIIGALLILGYRWGCIQNFL